MLTIQPHIRLFSMVQYLTFTVNWILDERSNLYCCKCLNNYCDVLNFWPSVFQPSFSRLEIFYDVIIFISVRKICWRYENNMFSNQNSGCFDNVAKTVFYNWTNPTTTSTTPFNKMIVISQLIVLGVQWVYDKTVRLVKIQSKDFLFNLKFSVFWEI